MGIKSISQPSTHEIASRQSMKKLDSRSEKKADGNTTEKDTFAPGGASSSGPSQGIKLTGAAGKILNAKGLEKSKYKYRVKSHARASDGTTYIAYADSSKKEGNYISSVAPDGKINWEMGLGEEGLESLKVGKDGTLYVRAEKALHAYHPEGNLAFRHEFDVEVKDHFVDSKGNNYFREKNGDQFYIVDNTGDKVKLPLKFKSVSPSEIKLMDDDTLFVRSDRTIQQIGLKKGFRSKKLEFKDPDEKMNRMIMDFSSTKDGGVLLTTQYSKTLNNSHALHADLHMGLGFGRFGGFRRHIPPDFEMSYTTITNRYIMKMDPEGKIEWSTGDIGSSPKIVFLSNDHTIYDGRYDYSEKRTELNQVSPDGETEKFAEVEGRVSAIHHRKSDDHIFVEHGDDLTELAPDGSMVRSAKREGDLKDLSVKEIQEDGKIIMGKWNGDSLYQWDPETGDVNSLTDHSMDLSYKLEKFEDSGDLSEEERKTIEHKEKYIVIGGVKVPIKGK